MRRWESWEMETRTVEYQVANGNLHNLIVLKCDKGKKIKIKGKST